MSFTVYSKDGADHRFSTQPQNILGRWWSGIPTARGALTSTSWEGSRILVYPITIFSTGTLDKLGVMVLTGAAGARLRVGIYQPDGPQGRPGSLLVQSGDLDCSVSSVPVISDVSVSVRAGSYYAAIATNGTACSTRTQSSEAFTPIGSSAETFSAQSVAWDYPGISTWSEGMPSSLAGSTPTSVAGEPHGIRFRIS